MISRLSSSSNVKLQVLPFSFQRTTSVYVYRIQLMIYLLIKQTNNESKSVKNLRQIMISRKFISPYKPLSRCTFIDEANLLSYIISHFKGSSLVQDQ